MLDVHAPHESVHTFKDFLIHIVTIVIGLLIAIGLEQAVEYIHHRHQIADTREALRIERQQNIAEFGRATTRFASRTTLLQHNLDVLVSIQKAHGSLPPSVHDPLNWHTTEYLSFNRAAWKTAQQSNVTELMPQDEVRSADRLYDRLDELRSDSQQSILAIEAARRYTVQDADPTHFSPAELAVELDLARAVLIWHYRVGSDMRNLNNSYSDFQPSPKTSEIVRIVHDPPGASEAVLKP